MVQAGGSARQAGGSARQAGGSARCQAAAAAVLFRLIAELADRHSVAWLCRQLGVARSGYCAWRQRQEAPGRRAAENARLTAEIETVFREHRGFCGSPRIHQELRAAGHPVVRHRVARRSSGLSSGPEPAGPCRPCCCRSSSPRARTAGERATSPPSAPAPGGGTWLSGSTCSAAVLSAGRSMSGWMPPW
jgi:hypothetical protein